MEIYDFYMTNYKVQIVIPNTHHLYCFSTQSQLFELYSFTLKQNDLNKIYSTYICQFGI